MINNSSVNKNFEGDGYGEDDVGNGLGMAQAIFCFFLKCRLVEIWWHEKYFEYLE